MAGFNTQYQMSQDPTFRESLRIAMTKVSLNVAGEAQQSPVNVLIGNITRGYPTIVNAVGHGFTDTGRTKISEVEGMTELNDRVFSYTVIDLNTLHLEVDSSRYSAHTGGGVLNDNALTLTQWQKRNQTAGTILNPVDTQTANLSGVEHYLESFALAVCTNPAIGDLDPQVTQPSDNDVEFAVGQVYDDISGVTGQDLR